MLVLVFSLECHIAAVTNKLQAIMDDDNSEILRMCTSFQRLCHNPPSFQKGHAVQNLLSENRLVPLGEPVRVQFCWLLITKWVLWFSGLW